MPTSASPPNGVSSRKGSTFGFARKSPPPAEIQPGPADYKGKPVERSRRGSFNRSPRNTFKSIAPNADECTPGIGQYHQPPVERSHRGSFDRAPRRTIDSVAPMIHEDTPGVGQYNQPPVERSRRGSFNRAPRKSIESFNLPIEENYPGVGDYHLPPVGFEKIAPRPIRHVPEVMQKKFKTVFAELVTSPRIIKDEGEKTPPSSASSIVAQRRSLITGKLHHQREKSVGGAGELTHEHHGRRPSVSKYISEDK